jgi:hypothetical protein
MRDFRNWEDEVRAESPESLETTSNLEKTRARLIAVQMEQHPSVHIMYDSCNSKSNPMKHYAVAGIGNSAAKAVNLHISTVVLYRLRKMKSPDGGFTKQWRKMSSRKTPTIVISKHWQESSDI